jgi:hypothetical protein
MVNIKSKKKIAIENRFLYPEMKCFLDQIEKYMCLRSPDRPYFSAADPKPFLSAIILS